MAINPNQVPPYHELFNPLLKALVTLGGSASIAEMYEVVVGDVGFSDDVLAIMHGNSNQTEIAYRLAWARTYLKQSGYLENSARGVWSLTEKGRETPEVIPSVIVQQVQEAARRNAQQSEVAEEQNSAELDEDEIPVEAQPWREQLQKILIEQLSPAAFERLTQRLLRESGFVHVEVTGRTGDGGIDGRGVARLNGLMSFHIAFQCKKYANGVGAPEIRNFRGAIQGVADRGLFITTGYFTRAALEEANRPGASPIDLVDGEQLAEKLKELGLGIKTEMIEKVTVDSDWLLSI